MLNKFYLCRLLCVFLLSFGLVFAQKVAPKPVPPALTVRQIMAEPSLAGMRAESEKLSPDGNLVAFLWNAEGKEPRDVYIVSTNGGKPRRLITPESLFNPFGKKKEESEKPAYGLQLKDDFVKERENQITIFDWSTDSQKLLVGQNGDLFIIQVSAIKDISLSRDEVIKQSEEVWQKLENNCEQVAALIPNLIKILNLNEITAQAVLRKAENNRLQLLTAIKKTSKETLKDEKQRQIVLESKEKLRETIGELVNLPQVSTLLESNKNVAELFEEIGGLQNQNLEFESRYRNITSNYAPASITRLTKTQTVESGAFFLGEFTVLYQANGNFFAQGLQNFFLSQISYEANPQNFQTVSNIANTVLEGDLAYVFSDDSKQRRLFVPNYLDELTTKPIIRRGFTEQKIYVNETDGDFEKPVEIKLPKAEGKSYIRSIKWAADNYSLIVDRIDKDTKRRQIFFVHIAKSKYAKVILIAEEIDNKWIAPLSQIVEPNPKNNTQILFASEKDGFNQLYLATLQIAEMNPQVKNADFIPNEKFSGNVSIKQLTKGNFEIDWAKWLNTGNEIVFSSTQEGTATREFFTVNKAGNVKKYFSMPDNEKTMKTNPQLSKNGETLLFRSSKSNQPTELFAFRTSSPTGLQKLTETTPESFNQIAWSEPKFIDIPTRDGKTIKAKIYLPNNPDKAKKPPMVIFVHGSGYLQNTINGWNNYYRETMFNTLLTQKGYAVLDIDYRGSAGYGRDWRTDVHDFLGGKDYDDHLDAIDFAVQNYNVNPQKIGVYGEGYGGFMAEMLAFRSNKIACAAALRPVADWKNYYVSSPVYTTERLGFPDKNPEAYKRSSPISYAEKLDKPLLILHGLADDNVQAQDSLQLVEKLMRLEKTAYFELMLYLAENHGFSRPTSWADEYERILSFFERHLRN